MTKLILIRHGQTDYNLKKRYCGITDIGLNNAGRKEAREIKNRLNGLRIDKVFCSDLKRSWQTAKIIFGNRYAIIKTSALREINFGQWEGMNFKQLLKKHSSIYKEWLRNPFDVLIPGGEKMGHFTKRIRGALKDIVKTNPNGAIAIISHLGPMRVMLNTIEKRKSQDFWKIELRPRTVYIIDWCALCTPVIARSRRRRSNLENRDCFGTSCLAMTKQLYYL